MTTTDTRTRFETKKQLAAWLATQGIALAKPITLKQGWFTVVPVLPPATPGAPVTFQTGVYTRGPNDGYHFNATRGRYVAPNTYEPFTAEECATMDVYLTRLNEVWRLIDTQTSHVHFHTQ